MDASSERTARQRRGFRLRAALCGLLVIFLVVGGYVLVGLTPSETVLEAESSVPATQTLPTPDGEQLPPPEPQAPTEPLLPIVPPAEMEPGGWGSIPRSLAPPALELPDQPYVGPAAPEFTGSPAPAGLGLLDATLFGKQVLGVHPELLERLQQIERANPELVLGVEMLVGYRNGKGSHARGLAVDINYFGNPYLMHESGEAQRDLQLGPVFHRIANLMLRRASVIPERLTEGGVDPSRALEMYRLMREESRAMIAYFRLMQDRGSLEHFVATRDPEGGGTAADALQWQMMRDYVTLSGRAGPRIPGLEYPTPEPAPGDPPFAGNPVYRGPEFGFLNLEEELIRAFTESGLRWGGTDMGGNSGDLMHFYLPSASVSRP